jgi:hypothetical protein
VDKKMIVLVVAIIMIVAAFAGCSEEKSRASTPKGDVVSGTMEPESGWVASSGDSEPWVASAMIPISINSTNVLSIEVSINIEDSDSAHSETDEGGDPDEIEVYLTSQGIETEPVTGTTPFSTKITPTLPTNASEGDEASKYFSNEWEINIRALCYSGKNPTGPGGIVPIIFLQYIDQGVAYTYDVKFTYEDFGE